MRRFVRTVFEDVDVEEIKGDILIHEHLNVDTSSIKKDNDACLMEPPTVVDELLHFTSSGGEILVDVTSSGNGRDPRVFDFISRTSKARIVCGVGYYFGLYLPLRAVNRSVDELAEEFIREITTGIDDSSVRAGVIGEIGSSLEVLPAEERIFRAAALAQKETGAGIITHTQFGWNAIKQINMLEAYGADLTKVGLGHMDLYPDPAIHEEVARKGAFVCIDNVGRVDYRPDWERVKMINHLFSRGFGSHVLISSDVSRRSHLRKNGGHGYGHVLSEFRKMLNESGFSQEELSMLYRENPLKLLAIEEKNE